MIAELAQLHDGVHECLGAAFAALALLTPVSEHDALLGHVMVDHLLQPGHVAFDHVFHL